MDVQFENQYIDNEQMMIEYGANILLRNQRKWMWMSGACAVYCGALWLADRGHAPALWALLYVGYIAWCVLLPYIRAKQYIRRVKAYYNGEIPQTCVQFGEKIVAQSGESSTAFHYDKMNKVHFLKYSILLEFGKGSSLMLSPNGFTKGTYADFKQFLRQKRPDLKIPE